MAERPKLGELLMEAGAIDQDQLRAALGEQKQWGRPLGMTLMEMGFVDEETLFRTLARQLNLPLAWLRGKRVKPDVLELVPTELAMKHRCLPLFVKDEVGERVLYLAMEDPANLEALDDLTFRVGHKIKLVLVAHSELDDALRRHYESGGSDESGGAPESAPSRQPAGEGDPELLLLERDVPPAAPQAEVPLEFNREPSGPTPVASDAVLRALTQLLMALIEEGIIDRKKLIERLGKPSRSDDSVVL